MKISKSTLATVLGAAGLGFMKRHVGSSAKPSTLFRLIPITITWTIRVHFDINDSGSVIDPEFVWNDLFEMNTWHLEQFIDGFPGRLNISFDDKYEEHPDNDRIEANWNREFIQEFQNDVDGAKDALRDYTDPWDDEGILEEEYETIEDLVSELYRDTKAKQGNFWNALSQNVTFTIDLTVSNHMTEDELDSIVDEIMDNFESLLLTCRQSSSMWWRNTEYEISPPLSSFARKPKEPTQSRLRKR
jgi:hypothetical protein